MTDEYKTLYDSWRREKQRLDIQPLPEGFYGAMTIYVAQLREQSRTVDKTTVKGKLVEKEHDHVGKMLEDLNRLRLGKLVTAELNGAPVEPLNLTAEEKRLQVELRRLLAEHTQGMKQVLLGREQKIEAPQMAAPPQVTPRSLQPPQYTEKGELTLKVVRFTQPLPAIMGVDMKTYGPFKAEDVVSLPAQNADNLIRKGIAKLVETEP
jgi:DNA replication initiation complex subunit (GINS family)